MACKPAAFSILTGRSSLGVQSAWGSDGPSSCPLRERQSQPMSVNACSESKEKG